MKKARILWLSDIHYCDNDIDFLKKYVDVNAHLETNQRRIKLYIDSVKCKINELKPSHILISGDLTFSGQSEQYENMYLNILKDYLDSDKNVRLIPIVGNHDLDRDLLLVLRKKLKLDSEFLDYSKRANLLEKVKKTEIDKAEYNKIIEKNIEAFHFITNSSIEKFGTINKINLFDLSFSNFKKFFTKEIEQRLNTTVEFLLNEDKTYSVIHDKEYNLIFINLNSAWFAWGDDTYENLFKTSSINFKEYGQLTYNSDALASILTVLKNNKSLLDENIVICQAHHGFPWIAYEELYDDGVSHLGEMLKMVDIYLTGHIHVQHNPPSKYFDRTYYFESPQLLDYHLYKEHKNDSRFKISQNHGFSLLEISENIQIGKQEKYVIENFDSRSKSPFLFSSTDEFKWSKFDTDFEFKLQKSIKTNVFEYSERNSVKNELQDENLIQYFECIKNEGTGDFNLIGDFNLNLNSFAETYFSEYLPFQHHKNYLNNVLTFVNDTTNITQLNFLNKTIDYTDFNAFLKNLLNDFKNIESAMPSLTDVDYIILDIDLYNFYKSNGKIHSLIDAKKLFESKFNILKYKYYEDHIKKVNIGFKLFTLSQYRKYICKKPE